MTSEQALFFAAGTFLLMIAVIVFCTVWDLKKNKTKYKQAEEERIEDLFNDEAEVEAIHVEILDMICGSGMVGSYRLPKSTKTFLVVFKDDEGEKFELSVSEDVYLSLEVGMCGLLTLVEGKLDSFELDEE